MSVDSDVFRCVISGSCDYGQMGDTQLYPAGHEWPEVSAGPDGLDEVIILADRRATSPWDRTVDSLLARL